MKQNIRYVGFRSTADGGRCFDFSVSTSGQQAAVSVEIAGGQPIAGSEKLLVQEYVSICFSKVKKLFGDGEVMPGPVELRLTSSDLAEYLAQKPAPETQKIRADRVPY
jgi:hypothetical protein